ncbi:MAG: hypothetical protein WC464_05155 [Bdellovibrionales bacterium]
MSNTTLMLTALVSMVLLLFISPGIFASNRGRILRNITLWLAIFLALALVYKNVGPGSKNPLFNMPAALENMGIKQDMLTPEAQPPANPEAQPAPNGAEKSKEGAEPEKQESI